MSQVIRASSLTPNGFVVEGVTIDQTGPVIAMRASGRISRCPGCGAISARIHSRHRRRLADLPIGNRPVRLVVLARRFHCDAILCGRRIFAERFDQNVLAPWGAGPNGSTASSIASVLL